MTLRTQNVVFFKSPKTSTNTTMNIRYDSERNALVITGETSFDSVELAKALQANKHKITRRSVEIPGTKESGWKSKRESEFTIVLR